MRKWKCIETDNNKYMEVGNIVYSNDDRTGFLWLNGDLASSRIEEYAPIGYKFVEVVEVKDFTKSDLQECDIVVFRNKERLVYFGNTFLYENCGSRALYMYEENLIRSDSEKQFDIMQIYRNGILIFDRVEEPIKSSMQIEIESIEEEQRKLADSQRKLADRLSELRKGL